MSMLPGLAWRAEGAKAKGERYRCEGQARGLICAAVAREYPGVSLLESHAHAHGHAESENDAAGLWLWAWTFPSWRADRSNLDPALLLVSGSMLGRIIPKINHEKIVTAISDQRPATSGRNAITA